MKSDIQFTESAKDDLKSIPAHDRTMILESIRRYLQVDATVESKKRKRLRTNELAAWELRLGKYRVFYNVEDEAVVKIIAVGFKEHNELFVKGEKIDL
jgi:mRNA-degrading endonuclease RelE of RelBE toxin-antitoxin system